MHNLCWPFYTFTGQSKPHFKLAHQSLSQLMVSQMCYKACLQHLESKQHWWGSMCSLVNAASRRSAAWGGRCTSYQDSGMEKEGSVSGWEKVEQVAYQGVRLAEETSASPYWASKSYTGAVQQKKWPHSTSTGKDWAALG